MAWRILIGALIVAALALGGWGLYRMLNPHANGRDGCGAKRPRLLTEQEARDQLTANNLQVEVKKVNGDEESKGTITAQDPAAQH